LQKLRNLIQQRDDYSDNTIFKPNARNQYAGDIIEARDLKKIE
jgi:hypothetical protein